MAISLYTQSFGLSKANLQAVVKNATTQLPVNVYNSASALANTQGLVQLDSSGNLSTYVDTAVSLTVSVISNVNPENDEAVALSPAQKAAGAVSLYGVTADGTMVGPDGSTTFGSSLKGLVSVAWNARFRRGSIRRHDALYGWYGSAIGGVSFNKSSGLSAQPWTQTVKMETEAPFHSAKLMWRNVAANALNNCKSLVGVTETNDNSTSALMGSPTISGTTYQAIAGAGSILGWRSNTYAGAATVNVAAGNASQQYAISDESPISSISRADGGSRPLLLYRAFHDGSVDGNWAFSTIGASLRTPSTPLRNRVLSLAAVNSDAITTLAATLGLTTTGMEVYPIVRHTVPVLSVWSVGDSTDQNSSLVADAVSSWGYRACLDASTPSNPVVYANFGASSQIASVYLANARAALAAGAPAPSVMVASPCSVNDINTTPNARIVETMRYYAQETLRLARDYDIPVVIWRPILPYNSLNSAGDAFRIALNAEMQALAAQCGVTWLTIPGLGDGANPERWMPAYNYSADGIHPNETAIDTIMAPALTPLLRALAVM